MVRMTEEEIKKTLIAHEKWLKGEDEGVRANFSGANLSGVNFSGANLSYANLSGADLPKANFSEAKLSDAILSAARLSGVNFSGACLSHANLSDADLSDADFSRAILSGADLSGADLSKAILSGTDLSYANLSGADLSKAILSGTDLSYANLSRADLSKAILSGADLSGVALHEVSNVPYVPMSCPSAGSFIGWKKALIGETEYIVKLLIPEDALRSSATGRKCRCNKATVLGIENLDGTKSKNEVAYSHYDSHFYYRVGEIISVSDFCSNRFDECAPGIHFFIDRQEAVDYIF